MKLSAVALRCVLIDDSREVLDALRGLLEQQGVAVVGTASSAAEGVRCVEATRPDVVLLDVDLGRESGFEVARRIDGAPVIFISADLEYAELAADTSAVGFLAKGALSREAIESLLAG